MIMLRIYIIYLPIFSIPLKMPIDIYGYININLNKLLINCHHDMEMYTNADASAKLH